VVLVAAGILAGCDPAPSTQLAPDQPMPDTSKMSPEEIAKLHDVGPSLGPGGKGSTAALKQNNTPTDRMGAPGG